MYLNINHNVCHGIYYKYIVSLHLDCIVIICIIFV